MKNKIVYNFERIVCESCAYKIEDKLSKLNKVKKAYINLINTKITIILKNSKRINDKEVEAVVEKIEPNMKIQRQKKNLHKSDYNVENLNCSNCAAKITSKIDEIESVTKVNYNPSTKKLIIKSNDKNIGAKKINKIIRSIEPDAFIKNLNVKDKNWNNKINETNNSFLNYDIPLITGSIIYFLAILIFNFNYLVDLSGYLKWIMYGISYILIGHNVLIKAFKNIKRGQIFDENFLMVIATIGAFAIREFPEAVAVMLFYKIGVLFQNKTVEKSRRSIQDLMNIKPEFANLIIGDKIKKVNPQAVNTGDIILVKPGEKVPLDGIVLEGNTMIDNSALTGESKFINLKEGSEVLSGSINQSNLIKIKVQKEFVESTVSKILKLIEEAAGRKAPQEKFITKFAKYYTPFVVGSAVLIAFIPPLIHTGQNFTEWIYRALIFLVVSCPCALLISIPLGFFGGIGLSSKRGILVKGSNYLDALNKVEHVIFDKTGTLTEGKFKVNKIVSLNNYTKDIILEYAAYAESNSLHPIANSIKEKYNKELKHQRIKKHKEVAGKGVYTLIDDKEILIGNSDLLKSYDVKVENINNKGNDNLIHLAIDKKHAGYLIIKDSIKKDSEKAIKKLKNIGVKYISMLTGDQKSIAKSVADKLNIDNYYAELLPDQKVECIEEIINHSNDKDNVIFVGDGINDAPVLARSDIGIAMGGLGSDAAIEAADIVLMTDALYKLVEAIKISNKTRKIVWQNIILALGVKTVVLMLGVFGLATMWQAVFADVGVALLAVLNSIRIIND
ncbi:MAG: cadmium-translocating P-type ATPase [Halanaerobiales bacterium]|nr:cadmium-translocating P-type ATPase [Halanaerobiales bacterium]